MDEGFTMRLMEYINASSAPFLALAFTSVEALDSYLREQSLSLLVVSEMLTQPEYDVPRIFLSGARSSEEDSIYRYQSAAGILEQISSYFFRVIPQAAAGDTSIYMVFSPIGRCGKTALALELVRQIPGSLYIGMEDFCSLPEEGPGFCRLLYSIMQKNREVLEELEGCRRSLCSGYILPSSDCYYDLRVLDREHLEWFCSQLRQSGQYTAIIFDVGAGVLDSPELFDCFDRILVPLPSGYRGNRKVSSMEAGLMRFGYKQVLERMEYLELPDAGVNPDSFQKQVGAILSGM